MSQARPGGRFERHPRLTGAGLLAAALVLAELGLRLAAPRALVFAHEMRRVHRYSRVARVDLRPSQSASLRIDRADGQPLFDFRLDVGPQGFRVEPPAASSAAGGGAGGTRAGARASAGTSGRYVHAIGDSYTMGWGVNAGDSYPARLARKLRGTRAGDPPASDLEESNLNVLNLGVDGFGAIGATHKSRELAERFAPAIAIYLFSPNDLDDDVGAAAVAHRSSLVHEAFEALDAVRRRSYVAGIPFALRYRLQFGGGAGATSATGTATVAEASGRTTLRPAGATGVRAGANIRIAERVEAGREAGTGAETGAGTKTGTGTTTGTATGTGTGTDNGQEPTKLLLPDPAALPAPPGDHPTFTALAAYREFLAARGARLLVLVLSNQRESLMALRFCREQGIEAHLFDVPASMRIAGEGHFNAEGNEAVAELVARLLTSSRASSPASP